MSGHRTDEMMTHLDGLCVTVNGQLVPASLEILVTTVLGGRGFLQGIRRLLLDIFNRNLNRRVIMLVTTRLLLGI